jgi:tRNA-dihydrouridine synthase B
MAFRSLCASLLPSLRTTTEMVSAKALCYGNAKTAVLTRVSPAERHASVQLFGSDPEIMACAARQTAALPGVTAIDINMGCPTPKIVACGDGCALMRHPEKARAVIAAVVAAVDLPVTVKFRKGWDSAHVNCVEFAEAAEAAGAAALCVHGRTRAQLYSGRADRKCIAAVKRAVGIPVTANGDIDSPEAALRCRAATNADMYMVGRAAFGNPWLLAQIDSALRGLPPPPPPPVAERLETAREQFTQAAKDKGEKAACLEARRHLSWYLRGIPGAAYYRREASAVSTPEDISRLIARVTRDCGCDNG